jgi:transposase
MTGRSRNTVRKVVRQARPDPMGKQRRRSLLDAFKAYVETRFRECELSAVRLLAEIRPMGYAGSLHTLRRFVSSLRADRRGRQKLTVRFETPPGKQAQVDWFYCGRFPDATGRLVRIYGFLMVLGFSRMLYVEFTRSMKVPELIRCHLNAFAFFGGWPQELLLDNMAQVKLPSGDLHPLFADFAAHHGLTVKTHRVRRPRTKGKIERGGGYLKDSFLNGRSFADFADLNAQGHHWLAHVANVRDHATTQRRPVDLWPEERLMPLASVAPYRLYEPVCRKVDWEGFVHFGKSRYSVPATFAGKAVLVGEQDRQVRIHLGGAVIAKHEAAAQPGACIADPKHVEQMWRLSLAHTQPPPAARWHVRFDATVAQRPLTAYEEVAR